MPLVSLDTSSAVQVGGSSGAWWSLGFGTLGERSRSVMPPECRWRRRHRSAAGIALTDLAWLDDLAGTWSCAELSVMHEASVPPLPARKIKKCLVRPLRE